MSEIVSFINMLSLSLPLSKDLRLLIRVTTVPCAAPEMGWNRLPSSCLLGLDHKANAYETTIAWVVSRVEQ